MSGVTVASGRAKGTVAVGFGARWFKSGQILALSEMNVGQA